MLHQTFLPAAILSATHQKQARKPICPESLPQSPSSLLSLISSRAMEYLTCLIPLVTWLSQLHRTLQFEQEGKAGLDTSWEEERWLQRQQPSGSRTPHWGPSMPKGLPPPPLSPPPHPTHNPKGPPLGPDSLSRLPSHFHFLWAALSSIKNLTTFQLRGESLFLSESQSDLVMAFG